MTDQATIAGLLALAIGLVRVLEKVIEWGSKKIRGGTENRGETTTIVRLDGETTRMVHDIHTRTGWMSETMSVKDPDGTPMIYSPRSIGDDMKDIASLIRDASLVNQRVLDRLESLDDRVTDVQANVRKVPRGR